MPKARPRAVRQYSDEFQLTAVRLSQQPDLQVKTVATALEIHPFMLSMAEGFPRWATARAAAQGSTRGTDPGDRAAASAREGLCAAARGA